MKNAIREIQSEKKARNIAPINATFGDLAMRGYSRYQVEEYCRKEHIRTYRTINGTSVELI